MSRKASFVLHKWPGLPGLAWAGTLLALLGLQLPGLLPAFAGNTAAAWLAWLLALTLIVYWVIYCRAVVTPQGISLLSSGLRKRWVTLPLTQVRLSGNWLFSTPTPPPAPLLDLGVDEDFDTGSPYVYAQVDNQEIELSFSILQYAALEAALLRAATDQQQVGGGAGQLTTDFNASSHA